jgi:hypothetical protein
MKVGSDERNRSDIHEVSELEKCEKGESRTSWGKDTEKKE